jgi:hypothetical protein
MPVCATFVCVCVLTREGRGWSDACVLCVYRHVCMYVCMYVCGALSCSVYLKMILFMYTNPMNIYTLRNNSPVRCPCSEPSCSVYLIYYQCIQAPYRSTHLKTNSLVRCPCSEPFCSVYLKQVLLWFVVSSRDPMYVCMHVCMYACIYTHTHTQTYVHIVLLSFAASSKTLCMHACMYVYMCACVYLKQVLLSFAASSRDPMYVCMHVCMYACIYTHIHIHTNIRTHSAAIRSVFPRPCICTNVCMYACVHACI